MEEFVTSEATGFDFWLSDQPFSIEPATEQDLSQEEQVTLLDLLDSLLNKGVIVSGDITLSVAGVDLLYVGLRLMVCTAEKAVAVGAVRLKNGRIV